MEDPTLNSTELQEDILPVEPGSQLLHHDAPKSKMIEHFEEEKVPDKKSTPLKKNRSFILKETESRRTDQHDAGTSSVDMYNKLGFNVPFQPIYVYPYPVPYPTTTITMGAPKDLGISDAKVEWFPSTGEGVAAYVGKAVVSAEARDGGPLWVIRSCSENGVIPGKFFFNQGVALIQWEGKETVTKNFQICCMTTPGSVCWIKGGNGLIPPKAIPAGMTSLGQTIFVGRGHYDDAVIPGTINPTQELCVYRDGHEVKLSKYEIMCEVKPGANTTKSKSKSNKKKKNRSEDSESRTNEHENKQCVVS